MNASKEKMLLKHVNPFALFLGKILCKNLSALYNTCKYWFRPFKDDDFDASDCPRSGTPRKLEADNFGSVVE